MISAEKYARCADDNGKCTCSWKKMRVLLISIYCTTIFHCYKNASVIDHTATDDQFLAFPRSFKGVPLDVF